MVKFVYNLFLNLLVLTNPSEYNLTNNTKEINKYPTPRWLQITNSSSIKKFINTK